MGGIFCNAYGPEKVDFLHREHLLALIWSWNVDFSEKVDSLHNGEHLLALIWSWSVDFSI